MKKRYCETPLQRLLPCDVGWGDITQRADGWGCESKSCYDGPMEKNCHYIVDTDKLNCPYCGSHLESTLEIELEVRVKNETVLPTLS